jgi:hypothetical protein
MFSIVPRKRIALGNVREMPVQCRGFRVVVADGLLSVRTEAVLVQRVDVDWGADAVDCANV